MAKCIMRCAVSDIKQTRAGNLCVEILTLPNFDPAWSLYIKKSMFPEMFNRGIWKIRLWKDAFVEANSSKGFGNINRAG